MGSLKFTFPNFFEILHKILIQRPDQKSQSDLYHISYGVAIAMTETSHVIPMGKSHFLYICLHFTHCSLTQYISGISWKKNMLNGHPLEGWSFQSDQTLYIKIARCLCGKAANFTVISLIQVWPGAKRPSIPEPKHGEGASAPLVHI